MRVATSSCNLITARPMPAGIQGVVMQIILLHPRFTHARSVTLTRRHLVVLFLALLVSIVIGAGLLSYLAVSKASSLPTPVRTLLGQVTNTDSTEQDKYLKENLALMA